MLLHILNIGGKFANLVNVVDVVGGGGIELALCKILSQTVYRFNRSNHHKPNQYPKHKEKNQHTYHTRKNYQLEQTVVGTIERICFHKNAERPVGAFHTVVINFHQIILVICASFDARNALTFSKLIKKRHKSVITCTLSIT